MVKPLSKTKTVSLILKPWALRCARCPHAIILYAFDLMHLNGRDLRQEPLSERRALLQALVGSNDESRIQFSEEFHGDGAAFFEACAESKLEGIVSKLATSRYESCRTKTWLKTKCFTEFELRGDRHGP